MIINASRIVPSLLHEGFVTRRVFRDLCTAIFVVSLAACGGGGGGPNNGGPNGPTLPVDVGVLDVTLSVTHLEMTDSLMAPTRSGEVLTQTPQGTVFVNDLRRVESVCPGIPPSGNQCTATSQIVDGVRYDTPGTLDYSIEYHKNYLSGANLGPWLGPLRRRLFSGRYVDRVILGGLGEYSAFLTSSIPYVPNIVFVETFGAAFGSFHDGRPDEALGSATWSGAMVARDYYNSNILYGRSFLDYDFVNHTVDLTLDSDPRRSTNGIRKSFEWHDLEVNGDGSFFLKGHGNHSPGSNPHPTLGYVDGDFYGPNAEEFAGVFERDNYIGAFGGDREADVATSEPGL